MDNDDNFRGKAKNWIVTIFNFEEVSSLTSEMVKYSAYGDEICPTTGRAHKQAFVCFNNAISWNTMKKLFPKSFFRRMKGNLEQNDVYCSKENKLVEYGTRPISQKEKGEMGKQYWEEQVKLAKIDPDLCDPKLQVTHLRSLERIQERALLKRKLETLDTLDNLWYVGEAGTGKSMKARGENPDAYIKQCNKWWDGYHEEEVIIIEDLDTTHDWMAYNINQWADRYPFPAEVKEGQKKIRPLKLIITSRYTPDQIFKDASTIASINRRFNFVHF